MLSTKNVILRIAGTIFGMVCLIHLLRLITRVPVLISCWMLPLWINLVGFVATGLLCIVLWRLSYSKSM